MHKVLGVVTFILALSGAHPGVAQGLNELVLPPGFTIEIYTDQVPDARQIVLGDKGTLFVGSRRVGTVYAVIDRNGDLIVDQVIELASALTMPTGLAFRDQALYVAAVNRILRFDDIESTLRQIPAPVLVTDHLPSVTHHGWKFLRFGADGRLYLPVGVPCNICAPDNPVFGTVLALDVQTRELALYATGIRNSVGFDWHPRTGELWFADNGRDSIGDDIPPDEVNRVSQVGEHFGFPFVYGNNVPQPEFPDTPEGDFTVPVLNLQAHVTPLGVHFYRGTMFPERYRGALFIAEHGSWDRSEKVGYRITVARVTDDAVTDYRPFVEGWLQGQSVSGRPVAFAELPDGSLLISDDHRGAVYRVSYRSD